ncbi:MAG: hypothetical protein K1Y01_16155 [Vicinamibacteria bacterium]|nr:hypothetical protein [Vicinamibacteria bacterium]
MSPLVLLFATATAAAVDAPKPVCALVKACVLAIDLPSCSPEQSRPIPGVVYDAQRCSEPRDLLAHGVTPEAGMGPFVYPFLGGRYRVVYDITGEAPISEAKFDTLALDLPLAAKLATRFSKTKYSIQYVDASAKRFHAARAEKLTGDAELLFLDTLDRRRTYYGWGSSKFGPWKLRGSAYVDIRVRPGVKDPKGIAYDVRIRTAPVNAMVNAIMSLGLFRGYVVGQIEDTMKDLVGAAAALSSQRVEGVLKDPSFSPEEREKVRALAALP